MSEGTQITYTLCYIGSIGVVFWSVKRLISQIPSDLALRTPCAIIAACFILYVGSLLAGLLGHYEPRVVALSTVVVALLVAQFKGGHDVKVMTGTTDVESAGDGQADSSEKPLTGLWYWALISVAALINLPLLLLTVHALQSVATGQPLAWDVQKYHLPFIVDSLQNHTLLFSDSPFRSHICGYELIAGFPSIYFRTPVGFTLFNLISIVFLVSSTFWLCREVLAKIGIRRASSVVLASSWTCGLWSLSFSNMMEYCVGKGEMFFTASLIAALALALSAGSSSSGQQVQNSNPTTIRFLLLAFLSLSLTAKIFAIPYALLILCMYVWRSTEHCERGSRPARIVPLFLLLGLFLFLFSSFFYLRTLLQGYNHDASVAYLAQYMTWSWFQSHPNLVSPKTGLMLLTIAITTAALCEFERRTRSSKDLWWIVGFQACGLISMPFINLMSESGDLSFRYIMPLVLVAFMTIALFIAKLQLDAVDRSRRFQLALSVLTGVMGLALLLVAHHFVPFGRGVIGSNDAAAQRVSKHVSTLKSKPLRIYSAGYLPYYLYGPDWQNLVFFDFFTPPGYNPESGTPSRLMDVVEQFHPDVLVVASPVTRADALQLAYILAHPDCFIQTLSDLNASVFTVNTPACDAIPHPPGRPIKERF